MALASSGIRKPVIGVAVTYCPSGSEPGRRYWAPTKVGLVGSRNGRKTVAKCRFCAYIAGMALKATAKKRRKAPTANGSDSFVYRGVRITRTWTNSKRRKEIDEAIRAMIQRGPAS